MNSYAISAIFLTTAVVDDPGTPSDSRVESVGEAALDVEQGNLSTSSEQLPPALKSANLMLSAGGKASRFLRDDFEQMLSLAEQLQEACDRHDLRIQVFGLFSFAFFTASSVVAVSAWSHFVIVSLVAAVAALTALVGIGVFQRALRTRLARDRHALSSMTRLLRETEVTFLSTDVLTPFERAQFEIRMSRLEIGEAPSRKAAKASA